MNFVNELVRKEQYKHLENLKRLYQLQLEGLIVSFEHKDETFIIKQTNNKIFEVLEDHIRDFIKDLKFANNKPKPLIIDENFIQELELYDKFNTRINSSYIEIDLYKSSNDMQVEEVLNKAFKSGFPGTVSLPLDKVSLLRLYDILKNHLEYDN